MGAGRRDFPFYDDVPARLSGAACAVILLGCAAGLAALLLAPRYLPGAAGQWVGSVLFVAVPLLGLALATRQHWSSLFRRPTARDIGIGLAFAPLTLLASAAVGFPFLEGGLTSTNAAAAEVLTLAPDQLALFLAGVAVQLLGEELMTILPFLVLLTLAYRRLPRTAAILVALIATSLMFGAVHLPTYHWHLGQSLLVIGAARLVLTASYLLTKNVWTSFIAHLTNDWSIFAVVLLARAHGA